MLWKGIVNQSFSPDEFAQYINTLSFSTWQPQFVVLHNRAAPTLQQWMSGPTTPQQRILNLEAYYRDQMGWSAGPHLFIDNQLIWAFTPLTTSGVHSPSWNHVSWGIEMVGDYSQESFDQGPGAAVADNAVKALATLHTLMGLDPDTLKFHKEDPGTTHNCPGSNVNKPNIIARVRQRMGGDHPLGQIPVS
jgi:N-acetylmuramoyl-L-alanine amidase-like protein